MKQVVRIELHFENASVDVRRYEIIPRKGAEYETVSMFQGHQVNERGEKANRRIYKSKLGIPEILIKPGDLISLTGYYGYIYVLKENEAQGRTTLVNDFISTINKKQAEIEDFLDEVDIMRDEAKEIAKYGKAKS